MWVVGIAGRQSLCLLAQPPYTCPLSLLPRLCGLHRQPDIWRVGLAALAACVGRNQVRFHVFVQPVEHDITEDGAHHPPLWDATIGGVKSPVLEIAGFEETAEQSKEAVIMKMLCEDAQQH